MDTLIINVSPESCRLIGKITAIEYASRSSQNFDQRNLSGKFFRFSVNGNQFLVFFETNSSVSVMSYPEALRVPKIAEICKKFYI